MKKYKKALLGMGTITTVIAPVAMVVSCGKQETEHFNLLPTYTGQADQLIALGIHADYYPWQLSETHPYEYLTSPGQYMLLQDNKFKKDFAARVKDLLPKKQGSGWWNQDAKNSEDRGSDPSYWQSKEAGVLLYEHYLLDDDRKIIDNSKAPKHEVHSTVQTNFRSSRDPYTRISKGVFFGWDLNDAEIDKVIAGTSTKADVTIKIAGKDETVTVTVSDAKVIKAMRLKRAELILAAKAGATNANSDWFYNDWYFVDSYHRLFLDNDDFQGTDTSKENAGAFTKWLIDSNTKSPYTTEFDINTGNSHGTNVEVDADIKALFDASTFQGDEVKHGVGPRSTMKSHHPIYEQQKGKIGAAPMFEGAVRDNQLYLFNVAWQIDNLVTYGTPYGKQHYNEMKANEGKSNYVKPPKSLDGIVNTTADADIIKKVVQGALTPKQVVEAQKAFENALAITAQLKTRMDAMKSYFKDLGVNGKTFGLLTIAPGYGVSTIQSMSKYSFIYDGLGFKQPLPKNLHTLGDGARLFTEGWDKNTHVNKYLDSEGEVKSDAPKAIRDAIGTVGNNSATLFNMDDNGWYWTVGNTGHMQVDQLAQFENEFDFGFIAARNENFKSDVNDIDVNLIQVKKLWKDSKDSKEISDVRVNYDLWNEGLKTPFVLHMLLDKIQNQVEKKLKLSTEGQKQLDSVKGKRPAAINWGNYFTHTYIGK